MRSGPRFPYRFWHWTCADENLFDLDRNSLRMFALLVNEAFKTEVSA